MYASDSSVYERVKLNNQNQRPILKNRSRFQSTSTPEWRNNTIHALLLCCRQRGAGRQPQRPGRFQSQASNAQQACMRMTNDRQQAIYKKSAPTAEPVPIPNSRLMRTSSASAGIVGAMPKTPNSTSRYEGCPPPRYRAAPRLSWRTSVKI